jgi:putative endonuclease
VYLLVCRGGRLYAGVTPDLVARMRKHRAGSGAKFTRAHPPESLLAAKAFASRAAALSMEHQVKRLSAAAKRALAASWALECPVGAQVSAVFAGVAESQA